MKIAVTGAMGQVGRFVVKDLLEHGYEVLAITHHHSDECPVPQITLDILDYQKVYESLKGCDAVIHLAAIPWPRDDKDSTVLQTNVVGDYNIVLAAGLLGIKHVAIASSDCAAGFCFNYKDQKPHYLPLDENHPAEPDNGYGISKILAERACDALTGRFPWMSISSLRISWVMDATDYMEGSGFYECIKDPEKGSWNMWSYIDGRDAAAAFRLAIEKGIPGHEVYYIAAENTRCQMKTQDLIDKYFPGTKLKYPLNDHESLEDTSKAQRMLGWKAAYRWDRV